MIYIGAEIPMILSPEVIAAGNRLMEQAAAKLPGMEEHARWRTALLIDSWRMSALYAEVLRRLNFGSTPEDRQFILNGVNEIDAYAASEDGQMAFEYPMLKQELELIRNGVALDFAAIPAGHSERTGHLMYGSTVKFQASCEAMRPDMWGFYLPEGGDAVLRLPLKTLPGVKFRQVTVKAIGEAAALRLHAKGPDGVEHLISDNPSQPVEIPASLLGGETLELIFRVEQPAGSPIYGLTGLDLFCEAE